MMRFSLLHPSRQRLAMADEAMAEWTGKLSGSHTCEYILSVDTDDRDLDGYGHLAARHGARLIVNANRSLVDAANRAAAVAGGEIFVVVSDDFGCPEHWDRRLAEVIGARRDAAVFVHDGVEGRILTLPILGRDLYRRLGYVYFPDYFSLFCDDDLTQVTTRLGVLIDARHLLFPHRHWSAGARPMDDTYARQNSNAAWWRGLRVYQKRQLCDFGLRPRTVRVRAAEVAVDARYFVRVWGSAVRRRLRSLRS